MPHPLLEFVRDHVVPFLDDNDPAIRRAAALAACRVLEAFVRHVQAVPRGGGGTRGGSGTRDGRRLTTAQHRIVDKVRPARKPPLRWPGRV